MGQIHIQDIIHVLLQDIILNLFFFIVVAHSLLLVWQLTYQKNNKHIYVEVDVIINMCGKFQLIPLMAFEKKTFGENHPLCCNGCQSKNGNWHFLLRILQISFYRIVS